MVCYIYVKLLIHALTFYNKSVSSNCKLKKKINKYSQNNDDMFKKKKKNGEYYR